MRLYNLLVHVTRVIKIIKKIIVNIFSCCNTTIPTISVAIAINTNVTVIAIKTIVTAWKSHYLTNFLAFLDMKWQISFILSFLELSHTRYWPLIIPRKVWKLILNWLRRILGICERTKKKFWAHLLTYHTKHPWRFNFILRLQLRRIDDDMFCFLTRYNRLTLLLHFVTIYKLFQWPILLYLTVLIFWLWLFVTITV